MPASTGSSATPIPLALPATNGITGQVSIPLTGAAISSGTVVDEVLTNQQPSDAPTLSRLRRIPAAVMPLSEGPISVILYIRLAFTQTITLQSYPSFSIIFPFNLPTGAAYYLAFDDTSQPATGWQEPWEGPAAIAQGNALSFTGLSQPITFYAGVRYYFALYAVSVNATPSPRPSVTPTPVSTATPTSSPSPGATPTAAPSAGPLAVNPSVLSFTAPGQTVTITASRSNFLGTFSASSQSTSIVTVSQTSPGSFAVTSGTASGNSDVVVTDSSGATFAVPVTVTISTGVISSHTRK